MVFQDLKDAIVVQKGEKLRCIAVLGKKRGFVVDFNTVANVISIEDVGLILEYAASYNQERLISQLQPSNVRIVT